MTIWRGTSAVPTLGPEIHVKFTMFRHSDSAVTGAANAVSRAREMVGLTLTTVNAPYQSWSEIVLENFCYYFRCPSDPTAEDLRICKSVYQHISTGIMASGLNVKVTHTKDTAGYVNSHNTKKSKETWTAGKRNGNTVNRGDIHIDVFRLDGSTNLAAKTVIHEASHKFASTADFGERGYTNSVTSLFREEGLTHDEAINNAESFARFAWLVYKARNG